MFELNVAYQIIVDGTFKSFMGLSSSQPSARDKSLVFDWNNVALSLLLRQGRGYWSGRKSIHSWGKHTHAHSCTSKADGIQRTLNTTFSLLNPYPKLKPWTAGLEIATLSLFLINNIAI